MSEWDDLPDLPRAIAASAQRDYGMSREVTSTLLTVSENATYLIQDPGSGREAVMRVHRHNYHNRQEIASELAWVNAIRAESDLLVPGIISTLEDKSITPLHIEGAAPRHAVMFERVPGHNLTLDDVSPSVYAQLGGIAAQLHVQAKRWAPPANFSRYRWDLHTMLFPGARFGYWRDHPKLTDHDESILGRAADSIAANLSAYSRDPDVMGLSHGDLHILNLMIDGEDLWAIDFDDCGIGWYMQDIAPAIAAAHPGEQAAELKAAWIDGYHQYAPMTSADLAILDDLILLRRFIILAWSATHPECRIPALYEDPIENTVRASEIYLGQRRHQPA